MISGESQCQRSAPSPASGCGWMSSSSPLARSYRTIPAYWDCVYTIFGSSGSTRAWKPSPPWVMNQSLLRIPCTLSVRDGPPTDELSCVPPYTV